MTTDPQVDVAWVGRRGGLYQLVKRSWHIVEPSIPFSDNWHIKLVCDHLEAMFRGEIRDLLLLMPPGTMKSLLTGVFFPAYQAIKTGGKKSTISISFDEGLTIRENGKLKDLCEDEWFKTRWPEVSVDRKSSKPQGVKWWYFKGGGDNFASSIKGKATGHHGDLLRVDDPTKPKDTRTSDLEETKVWWRETFSSRKKDPATTQRLVVQQRLAEDDLPAMLMESDTWVVVCLPMEWNPDTHCSTEWGEDPRTEEGGLLWPDRYPLAEVEKLKGPDGVGEVVFATQYNQLPQVKGGFIFKDHWFQIVEAAPEDCHEILSCDMRFKEATDSGDMVVYGCWGKKDGKYYRKAEARGRWSFVESCKELVQFSQANPKALLKLVENKANGPAVVNALKKAVPGMVLVEPLGSKIARANGCAPLFESGVVYLVRAPWNEPYKNELTKFPRGKFDDRVDETSQALARLRDHRSNIDEFEKAMDALRSGRLM